MRGIDWLRLEAPRRGCGSSPESHRQEQAGAPSATNVIRQPTAAFTMPPIVNAIIVPTGAATPAGPARPSDDRGEEIRIIECAAGVAAASPMPRPTLAAASCRKLAAC